MVLTYSLQIATILITLALGLISYFQTKKLQHGQNIIAVTTAYRTKRSEQLKECVEKLITNTNPKLLALENEPVSMLKEAVSASEQLGVIMHRNFDPDREIMTLSEDISNLAIAYVKSNYTDEAILNDLLYTQKFLKLKSDMYSSAEWRRIKSETKGEDTSADLWFEYYNDISKKFEKDFEELRNTYKK